MLARDVGLANVADPALLEYAAAQALIVLPHDRQTLIGFAAERLKQGLPMPGLVIARPFPIGKCVDDLLMFWFASEAEEWAGRIMHVPM